MSDDNDPIDRLKFDQLTLKTAQENLSDRVSRLEDFTQELREIVLGDRRKKIDGLVSVQDEHATFIRKVNAVFFQDDTGQKGYLHDVDVLMGRYKEKNELLGIKWQSWTAIAVAVIMAAGTFFKWDAIVDYLNRKNNDPVDKAIESAKHRHIRHVVVREVPADSSE